MQDKNVCPNCGQIYDIDRERCPLCGTSAPTYTPTRRPAGQERRSVPADRRTQKQEQERYLQELEQREREQRDATRARVPRGCLVFSAVLLVVALLIGGSFLLWKTGLVNFGFYSSLAPAARPEATTAPEATDSEGITLSQTELTFDTEGVSRQLTASATGSAVGAFGFVSGDTSVATVNANGLVTAIGSGETDITVTLGDFSAVCKVVCSFPEPTTTEEPTNPGGLAIGEEPKLNNTDMTFFGPDEFFLLKVTNADKDAPIVWSSADTSVATVDEDGKVVAVGDGRTLITATLGTATAECIVRCNFE